MRNKISLEFDIQQLLDKQNQKIKLNRKERRKLDKLLRLFANHKYIKRKK